MSEPFTSRMRDQAATVGLPRARVRRLPNGRWVVTYTWKQAVDDFATDEWAHAHARREVHRARNRLISDRYRRGSS